MAKIRVDWEKLRTFEPTPILELETELEEAVKQEIEARRQAHLQEPEPKKKKRGQRR